MKMGNETSHLSGLEVNEKAVEITDFWAHFHATVNDSGHFFNLKGYGSISVFKSESAVLGPLWSAHTPLEKCAINLMTHRHPHILRYVRHWQQRGVQWLATEPAQPLAQVLAQQDALQVCLGLHRVLQALAFLHNKAFSSHNNISIGAVYVMEDGYWKLGGMEFLKPFKEMNSAYLKQAKKYRYDKAVDPNEESSDDLTKVDQYAFCSLVDDVFKGRNEDDVPHLREFKKCCQHELQNPTASTRPNFSALLAHKFFKHDFIVVDDFLTSLPLKAENEKREFFCGLLHRLGEFNEVTVARQLAGPLLSRLVLLDATAREKLLPFILVPRKEADPNAGPASGLFSMNVFKTYITPHLLKMFRVRDIQVRLLLLKHFSGYSTSFSKDDLKAHVLPELLLGIKDTSDNLVSMTLYCLAGLVPILGAATVIGERRFKLFMDGRPLTHRRIKQDSNIQRIKISSQEIKNKLNIADIGNDSNIKQDIKSELILNDSVSFGGEESDAENINVFLYERPSPDGGEDMASEVIPTLSDEEENWSDWADNENRDATNENREEIEASGNIDLSEIGLDRAESLNFNDSVISTDDKVVNVEVGKEKNTPERTTKSLVVKNDSKINPTYLQKAALDAKAKKLTDITELDIKNQKFNVKSSSTLKEKDEFDFFTDMTPVIEKASVFDVNQKASLSTSFLLTEDNATGFQVNSKLNFAPVEVDGSKMEGGAWGDADWEDD